MALDEVEQLPLAVLLGLDGKLDVGPVEAKHLRFDTPAKQPSLDVCPRRLVRRRRHRNDRYVGKDATQLRQVFIFAPERRPPLRNAMRLVDGDQADIEPGKRIQHPLGHQPFRREVEQPRLARRDAAPCRDIGITVDRGIDRIGGDAGEAQCRDLILHQRHQRRNDNGQPALDQRRNLIAQRFARTRRHDRQHVAAAKQCLHHRGLSGTEIVETEHVLEDAPFGIVRRYARRRYLHH